MADELTKIITAAVMALPAARLGDGAPSDRRRDGGGAPRQAPGQSRHEARTPGHLEQGVQRGPSRVGERPSPRESRGSSRDVPDVVARLEAMTWQQVRTVGFVLLLFVVAHYAARVVSLLMQ